MQAHLRFLPPAADLDQCVTVYVGFYGSCNAAEAEHWLHFLFPTTAEQFLFFFFPPSVRIVAAQLRV